MRISDWSSDVCSSDLRAGRTPGIVAARDDDAVDARHQARRRRARTPERAVGDARALGARPGGVPQRRHHRPWPLRRPAVAEIGRASWRERVWQYVLVSGRACNLKTKNNKNTKD